MPHVYSTLSCNTAYAVHANNGSKGAPIIEKAILIKGGSGVASLARNSDGTVITPYGVATHVTLEDLEILQRDYHFKEHMKHGFIKIDNSEVENKDKVRDMNLKDGSSPLTPAHYENKKDGPKPEGMKGKVKL